jgi:hypothetical protein
MKDLRRARRDAGFEVVARRWVLLGRRRTVSWRTGTTGRGEWLVWRGGERSRAERARGDEKDEDGRTDEESGPSSGRDGNGTTGLWR